MDLNYLCLLAVRNARTGCVNQGCVMYVAVASWCCVRSLPLLLRAARGQMLGLEWPVCAGVERATDTRLCLPVPALDMRSSPRVADSYVALRATAPEVRRCKAIVSTTFVRRVWCRRSSVCNMWLVLHRLGTRKRGGNDLGVSVERAGPCLRRVVERTHGDSVRLALGR